MKKPDEPKKDPNAKKPEEPKKDPSDPKAPDSGSVGTEALSKVMQDFAASVGM